MKIKPIRTRKDHGEALAEIQELWGAPKGSADRHHRKTCRRPYPS